MISEYYDVESGFTLKAGFAVDGNSNSDPVGLSCALTNFEMTEPWLVVDLGVPLQVTGVYFTNVDHDGEQNTTELNFEPSKALDSL